MAINYAYMFNQPIVKTVFLTGLVITAIAVIIMLVNVISMILTVRPLLGEKKRMNIIKAIILTLIDELFVHRNLKRCRDETFRWIMHQFVLWGFAILMICTGLDSLEMHHYIDMCSPTTPGYCEPLMHHLHEPIKIAFNVGGVLLLFGSIALIVRRAAVRDAREATLNYDWYLIILLLIVAITGFLAQAVRLVAAPEAVGAVVYAIHLIAVAILFITIPYTKAAHVVYRFVALVLANYKGVKKRERLIA
ncbi:MAG: hypothetical protein B6V02_00165 [Thermoprotei archaeon ex4572_64]|nr:MAG: hypothetical protein B6V02_00165 [Thermoprotei archaeon ex4572_64]